jgi:hypothetical protein
MRRLIRRELDFRLECAYELRPNQFNVKFGIKDDVEIDSRKVAVCSAELVQSHLNYREDCLKILKSAAPLGFENALVSVKKPVVIDSDD